MGDHLDKLLAISGPALSRENPAAVWPMHSPNRAAELKRMLGERNGFYAFESALHVFPAGSAQNQMGLNQWNSESLWRDAYEDLANECFFFAEDVFGGQFCIRADSVYTFDPETGAQELVATTLDGWAQAILENYDFLTGFTLAHEWQNENGALLEGLRLIPLKPFVLQGEPSLENLVLGDAATAMRARGPIAVMLRYLPDGARVQLETVS